MLRTIPAALRHLLLTQSIRLRKIRPVKQPLLHLSLAAFLFGAGHVLSARTETVIPNYRQLGANLTYSPAPNYPRRAQFQGVQGAGKYKVNVDTTTGKVSSVEVVGPIGYKELDDAVADALRRWKVKPQTVSVFYVPVLFFFDKQLEKTYDEALVYASYAPFPQAPFKVRSDIRGEIRGWYQLSIDRKTGLVSDVKVSVTSHSSVLDQTAIATYRRWRFAPNNIATITLPAMAYPLWHL